LTIQADEALFWLGDFAATRQRMEEGQKLAQANAGAASRAAALDFLGCIATDQGDYTEARSRLEESVAVARWAGGRQAPPGMRHHRSGGLLHTHVTQFAHEFILNYNPSARPDRCYETHCEPTAEEA